MQHTTLQDVESALRYISADMPRDDWSRVLMGIKNEFGDAGYDIAEQWSQSGGNYSAAGFKSTWRSIKASGGTTIASVFKLAIDSGYKPEKKQLTAEDKARLAKERELIAKARAEQEAIEEAERKRWHGVIAEFSQYILNEFTISVASNAYLSRKKVKAFGVFGVKKSFVLMVNNDFTTNIVTGGAEIKQFFATLPPKDENGNRPFSFLHIKRGDLAIPVIDINKVAHNIQFINEQGTKFFIKNGRKSGCFHFIGSSKDFNVVAVAEGYATGASIHQATNFPVAVAFDAGNLTSVATQLKEKLSDKSFLICADDDAQTKGNPGVAKANEAAVAVNGIVAVPDFSAVNDADISKAA